MLLIKRSGDWWEHIVLETFTSQEWLENFRLSKDTFDYLCTELTPYLQYQDTHLRKAVSVKKRVAITLWSLASPAEYRTVSHLFGVGRSTVCEVVHETCQAIVDHLLPKYIRFPNLKKVDEFLEIDESCERASFFPTSTILAVT